jgi:hypothetical protein
MEKQYLPKSKSILVLSGEGFKKLAANNTTDTSAGTTQTTPIDRNSLLYKYERWGLYNDFPQKWNKAIESNETLAAALYWVTKAIISGGVVYGTVQIDPVTKKETMAPAYDQRIEDFFKRSNIKRYFKECSNEFWRFWNAFPEFILTKDRKEIYSISCQESTFCRFETQNENGVIPRVFISANWHLGDTEVAQYVTPVPCLDPYQEPVSQMKAGNSYKYILPLQGVDSGRVYYQYAPHHTLLNGKWLDLANEIANYKLSLIRNQMTVKYIIYVHEKYWTSKYADWQELLDDEKIIKINELKKEIEEKLTGTKNAGKSIHIPLAYDEFTNQTIKLIEIQPIKDEIKEGAWIEESLESVSHILFALGLDGSLVGNTPGKTSFSGSDKRESFYIFITNSKTEQDTILEPLEVVRDYNGWDPKLKFWFKNYYLQTLDAVAPAARNTTVPK